MLLSPESLPCHWWAVWSWGMLSCITQTCSAIQAIQPPTSFPTWVAALSFLTNIFLRVFSKTVEKLGPLEMHRTWCYFWPLNVLPCFLSVQIICLSKRIWEQCHQNRFSSLPSSVTATAQKEVSPVRASWHARQQCSNWARRTATIRNHVLILDFTSYN